MLNSSVSRASPQFRTLPSTDVDRAGQFLPFCGLLLFLIVYYARPGAWLTALEGIPLAKLSGALALAPLFLGWLLRRYSLIAPKQMWILFALYAYAVAGIPFAVWRAGSFDWIFTEYSKVVLMFVVIINVVCTMARLRTLLVVVVSTGLMVSIRALQLYQADELFRGRIAGLGGDRYGFLGNPNELAATIVVLLPFCLALFNNSPRWWGKFWWGIGSLLMVACVIATVSRGGFLCLLLALAMSAKGYSRTSKAILLIALLLVSVFFATEASLQQRMSTILNPEEDKTGSSAIRIHQLEMSLRTMVENPLFGVGMRNFQVISGNWLGMHNSYTQVGAELGIPALCLFLWFIFGTLRQLRQTRKCLPQDTSKEVRALLLASETSLWVFILSACFADFAYEFPLYLLIGIALVLSRLTQSLSWPAQVDRRRDQLWGVKVAAF